MLKSVRYYSHRKLSIGNIENGEADTVQAYRAFFNYQGAKLFGKAEPEFPAAFQRFFINANSGGVNMPLNNVAIEPAVHKHTTLNINKVAGFPMIEIAFLQGFGNSGNPVAVVLDFFN